MFRIIVLVYLVSVSYLNAQSAFNVVPVKDTFIWGINGHPISQDAYLLNDIEIQINLICEAGMNYYRVDMPLDSMGNIVFYRTERLIELLEKAKEKNIKILPMLYLAGLNFKETKIQSYQRGKRVGATFAKQYKDYFDYYELGNEEEAQNEILTSGAAGNHVSHYDSEKMIILSNYLKGMNEGIKEQDPDAKTIIDNAGWLHYAFFDILIANEVDFDILGYHFYSNMGMLTNVNNGSGSYGNMIERLATYGKPIWITEINRRYGSINRNVSSSAYTEDENKETAQSQWLEIYCKEVLEYNNTIKAFFVYELYDEPVFAKRNMEEEMEYGLIKWLDNEYSKFERKPAFYTTKFIIEEYKYGLENFENALLKYGAIDSNDIINTTNKPDKNKILDVFLKEYFYDTYAKQQYMILLDRELTDEEINKARKILKKDKGNEKLIRAIALSNEFKNAAGNTKQGFRQRLYQRLTRSNPVITDTNISEKKAIQNILISDEYLKLYVNSQHKLLYAKEISNEQEQQWLTKLKAGMSQQEFIKDNLLSQEFWNKAIITGYENRNGIPFYVK